MQSFDYSFSLLQDTRTGAAEHAVPVCSILNSDFGFKSQHLPRSPWLGVYNTGSGLPALMVVSTPRGSHPAAFIVWTVTRRKCSMPPASHSPGGCRPPAGGCPPIAPGQRVPYAYTDLFGFQGAQPVFPGCDFIVADFHTVSECPVVTVPCRFVTVGG